MRKIPYVIGGPSGYMDLLEAIADPQHDRHAEFVDLYGADFDPRTVNLKRLEAAIDAIAERSQRQTSANRRKSAKP